MKNKIFWIFTGLAGILMMGIIYTIMTSSLLIYNLKNRGILPPYVHYQFAQASLDSNSLVLYNLTAENWDHSFIHKVHLTPTYNGLSVQLSGIHLDETQMLLTQYAGDLPDKLATYQIATHFLQEWPISVALFHLALPTSTIRLDFQKTQAQIYQVKIVLSNHKKVQLSASALINIGKAPFQIIQAQAQIQDPDLLNRLQEYAHSKHHPIPDEQLIFSISQNGPKTTRPDNSTLSGSK